MRAALEPAMKEISETVDVIVERATAPLIARIVELERQFAALRGRPDTQL